MTITSLHPRRLGLPGAAAIAIAVAGCGSAGNSSSGGGATDPAKAIPASASFYLEATVHPTGRQKTDLEAALSKILRTSDPGAKIKAFIDRNQTHGQTFEKDVAPWLGAKAAVAITGFTTGKPDWAVVVNSTDDAKASKSLQADPDYSVKRSYEGVDYRVNPKKGDAQAVVDHFAIDGSENGLKQIAHLLKKGGDSLADNADLQDARKAVGGRPGFMFVELPELIRAASTSASAGSSLGPAGLSALDGLFKSFRAFGVGIGADAQAIRMSVASIGSGAATGNGPASALPLDQAPGGTWLAFSQRDIGKSIAGVLASFGSANSGSGTGSLSDSISQFETATGLNVKRDLLSWMGDAELFVEGDSVPALGGALVVQSTDPARTRIAIDKIRRLLGQFNQRPGAAPAGTSDGFTLPVGSRSGSELQIGLAGSRFIIAFGKRALRDAVHPASTLGSSATFKSASGLLGGAAKPSFYVDFQTVTRFLSLAAHNSASFAKAKPYLDAFTAIVGGGSGPGKAEVAIGLK